MVFYKSLLYIYSTYCSRKKQLAYLGNIVEETEGSCHMFYSSDYFSRVQFVWSIFVFYFIFCLDTYHSVMTIQLIFFTVIAQEKCFLGACCHIIMVYITLFLHYHSKIWGQCSLLLQFKVILIQVSNSYQIQNLIVTEMYLVWWLPSVTTSPIHPYLLHLLYCIVFI